MIGYNQARDKPRVRLSYSRLIKSFPNTGIPKSGLEFNESMTPNGLLQLVGEWMR